MYLKSSTLKITQGAVEGEDAVYVNFSGSERLRLVAVFKDRKTGEAVAQVHDLLPPGHKRMIPRATFEKEYALAQATMTAAIEEATDIPF